MMNNTQEQVAKIASVNGINVYHIKTDKFKTNTINIFFQDNLSTENVAKNAIIPAVLRRGCKRLPTLQDIALYLEQLYGAAFDCGVSKKGEHQIIQFYIEFVSDKYTGEQTNLFEKAFGFLYELITEPILENGVFKNEYIDQEKENLKKLIESRVNDKSQYAVDRCYEEMCKNEQFGIYEYGAVQDLQNINSENLFKHYKYFVETLPMYVFMTGEIEPDRINRMIDKLSKIKRGSIKNISESIIDTEIKEVKDVTEGMNITQGKLSLGFRTNISPKSDDYYKLLVYNGILGGGVHSKLFQNVREKESLAYYISSRLEKFKGLMVISSGIEIQNAEKAKNIIMKQLDEMKKGNITDYEYESTLKTTETGIKSFNDNQLSMTDFYLSQAIINTDDTLESIIGKVKKVSVQDVVDVSKKIQLDTVYFLTSKDTGRGM